MVGNYQDTDWSTGEVPAPSTDEPCSLSDLCRILKDFGYELVSEDPIRPFVDFVKKDKSGDGHLTLGWPEFHAKGHKSLVYERAYIFDFLLYTFGRGAKDGHKIRAILKSHGLN